MVRGGSDSAEQLRRGPLQEIRRFEEAITAFRDAAAIFRESGDRHRTGAVRRAVVRPTGSCTAPGALVSSGTPVAPPGGSSLHGVEAFERRMLRGHRRILW